MAIPKKMQGVSPLLGIAVCTMLTPWSAIIIAVSKRDLFVKLGTCQMNL